jgi:sugar lactone lactonase YvrE
LLALPTPSALAQVYQWTNYVGMPGGIGNADGMGSAARFYNLSGVTVDASGNVYVADTYNNTIRKVTPGGVVSTLAGLAGNSGSSDGTGSAARFHTPTGVAVDGSGNVYVADTTNCSIRKVTPDGVVSTLAGGSSGSSDGAGSAAKFKNPQGVAVDGSGNLYVADTGNYTIRLVTPSGVVSTLAGVAGTQGFSDGTGSAAIFGGPSSVALDASGNVYVADTLFSTIRKVTPGGVVSTLAGSVGNSGSSDGTGSAAKFNGPSGVSVDGSGNIYVADNGNCSIRKVTPGGVVSTLAGLAGSLGSSNGSGSAARFFYPTSVAVDSSGNVYVADSGNNTLRKVVPGGVVSTLAGLAGSPGSSDGTGNAAQLSSPAGVMVDGSGNVYVADQSNQTIRKVTPGGVVSTLAGRPGYIGRVDGTGSAARFDFPQGVAVDASGNVYVADTFNYTIRKVTPAGVVSTLAGLAGSSGHVDATGTAARFYAPSSVAVDSSGNVYVVDRNNGAGGLRKVTSAGVVSTLSGMPMPTSVAVDGSGNLYVADALYNVIFKMTPGGVVSILAGQTFTQGSSDGTGSAARFNGPQGVAVDGSGNVYVVDSGNETIRMVTPGGVVNTIGGTAGLAASADGIGASAQFSGPLGIAVSSTGTLYVADSNNNRISMGVVVPAPIPVAAAASSISTTGATLNGTVNANGFSTDVSFDYGLTTAYGTNVPGTPTPVTGSSATSVSAVLTGLNAATTYHFRVNGTSSTGTTNGTDMTFTTSFTPTSWRQQWYSTTSNTGTAADNADPFNTGVPNLVSFALLGPNQNPATVTASMLPQPQKWVGSFVYTFTEPAGVSNVTYGAQYTPSLTPANWQPITDSGAGTLHIFSVPFGSNTQMFLRLTLTNQEP